LGFYTAQELLIKKQGLEEVMEVMKQGSSAATKQVIESNFLFTELTCNTLIFKN
jgi:hypothetical protein